VGHDLLQRFYDTGDLDALNTAVQKFQEVVNLTPQDHPDRAGWLHDFAVSVRNRYQRLGDVKDLEAAVEKFQEAVDLTPVDHPDRAGRLQSVAKSFGDWYQRLGELKDLEAALKMSQEAIDLTPVDHPDRGSRLQSLAACFGNRYRRLGDLKDLDTTIQKLQEAVDLIPSDLIGRARQLKNLSTALIDRYQRLGELKDVEAALQRDKEALDLIPVDHPDRADQLRCLAVSSMSRYWRLGQLKDLETVVQISEQVVDLTPSDHPEWAGRLQNLATSLGARYRRLGELRDLEATVQKWEQTVDLTPADHPERAVRLQYLAESLNDRYQRLSNLKDLEAAVQKIQEAVHLTPTDHPDRAGRLQGLAMSLGSRYQRLGELKDLEGALKRDQEAVDLTPTDHPQRADRLQSLARSLGNRYQRLEELKDLQAALQSDQEAVDLTPPDHSERARRLQGLATSFSSWYKRFQNPKDLRLVHTYYDDSFNTQASSDPEPSWNAALKWASFSKEFHPAYCSTAYSAAFNLLPQLLWMGHSIRVRQDAIHRLDIGNTASAATRISLTLSDPISAIQFFEQGLATTFQQMLQLRPDLDRLPPDYAQKLEKLSYELYCGITDNPSKVARERQELLQDIRRQPGLEHFLLPEPYSVLCQASQGGPVVMLNSHEDGCDGIIILNSTLDPVHVALPTVTLDTLKFQKKILKELLRHCNVRAHLLTWLWNNIVEPIYQVLASVSNFHKSDFPQTDFKQHDIHKGRLWWLPSGSFTGLPLHACPQTDDFIHSYTATLGSLLEAQAKKPVTTQHKMGVVGVTHTGLHRENYLEGVEQEVQKICAVIKDPNLECIKGEQATPTVAQNLLQNCSWVHLACHGTQDLMEPAKSRLLLYGGTLELETILRMPLSNAEFVFLAACQTAMGDAALVNESFHLGGGFIAAGFRGAIGTLWSMNDEDGPTVAETVYSHLFRDGRQPQASDAAEALQL
ncbi:CHAT domain-containing protein, partial [Mycena maculata]